MYGRGVDTNHHWAGDDGADYNLSMADRHTRRIKLHVRLIPIYPHITIHIHSCILMFTQLYYTYLCHAHLYKQEAKAHVRQVMEGGRPVPVLVEGQYKGMYKPLIPVDSCFGGLAIYRLDCIYSAK